MLKATKALTNLKREDRQKPFNFKRPLAWRMTLVPLSRTLTTRVKKFTRGKEVAGRSSGPGFFQTRSELLGGLLTLRLRFGSSVPL